MEAQNYRNLNMRKFHYRDAEHGRQWSHRVRSSISDSKKLGWLFIRSLFAAGHAPSCGHAEIVMFVFE